jgi:hypothetical protein
MALINSTPIRFSPVGVSDALDGTNVFPGAMLSLQNLIPDPSTKNLWQCRPASLLTTSFGGFSSPGFVSALEIIGDFAVGMIATTRNAGKDEPFFYNLHTGAFVTVSGVTNANTPLSPSTTGAWTPPSMALIGTKVVVTHPGFTGAGNVYIGVMDISNPSAPSWSGTNLTGAITFTTPPSWVAQFNQRAYYIINPPTGQPSVVFSDSLNPTNVTNANQALTFGDSQHLTCAAGLALFNQLGGIVQSLMVFKQATNIFQITGDPTTSNLTVNSLNVATGTLAPLSVTNTSKGLMFVAPDGLRSIDFYARVSDPIGVDGSGVNVPFIFAVVPSRIQASCNTNVMRISVQNGAAVGSPTQDFWLDMSRQKWSGPHTFPASMIANWNNTFIIAPTGVTGSLWQSDVVQSSTSTFVENGTQLTWQWRTSMLPDDPSGDMSENCMIETTVKMALSSSVPVITAFAQNQNDTILDTVTVTSSGGPTIWGAFTWGAALWQGQLQSLFPRQLQWTQPLVFQRLSIQLQGMSATGIKIGDMHARYQKLGYLGAYPTVAA